MARIKTVPKQNTEAEPAPPEESRDLEDNENVSASEDNDESEDGSETGSESDSEISADELRKKAKEAAQTDLESAIDLFSEAIYRRSAELECQDLHPDLADYWFDYGDALLRKEEQSSEFFSDAPGDDSKTSPDKTPETAEESSWQCLEIARICYEAAFKRDQINVNTAVRSFRVLIQQLKSWEPQMVSCCSSQTIANYGHTRLRIGDLLVVQMRYIEAAVEYSIALGLALDHNMSIKSVQNAALPLALTYRGIGRNVEAKSLFQEILKFLETLIRAEDSEKELWLQIHEDLQLQCDELDLLAPQQDAVDSTPNSTDENPTISFFDVVRNFGIEKTDTSIDAAVKPVRTDDAPIIDLGIAVKKRKTEPESKQ